MKTIIFIIASLNDISIFYIKYLTMNKVHMHAGAIRKLLYGCAYGREIIHSLNSWIIFPYIPTDPRVTYT